MYSNNSKNTITKPKINNKETKITNYPITQIIQEKKKNFKNIPIIEDKLDTNFFNQSFSTFLNSQSSTNNINKTQIHTAMTNSFSKNQKKITDTVITNCSESQYSFLKIDDNNQVIIEPNKFIVLISYRTECHYKIFLNELINKGSYNNIFSFSTDIDSIPDKKIILRVSNNKSTVDSINSELKGIKIQYELCTKSDNIGAVIDFGKIFNNTKNNKYKIQEYSIIQRYGINLETVLRQSLFKPSYNTIIIFMKELLLTLQVIHNNNYAHLDLKPENILLKDIFYCKKKINKINFVIVDFGGAKKIKDDISREINGQMASPAFSPPEILLYLFGKKSDIWAYGLICYLLCINEDFTTSKLSKVFLGQDATTIQKKIYNEINNNLENKMNKLNLSYKKDDIKKLKSFFINIFNCDNNKRPNTHELLNHVIFT